MEDFQKIQLCDSKEKQNWLKIHTALFLTRLCLVEFVNSTITEFHQTVLEKTRKSKGLSSNAVCTTCFTAKATHCPQSLCEGLFREIKQEHYYSNPSWKISDARKWCVSAFEIAKCFMPVHGYKAVQTSEKTDFNGLINVVINCKKIHQKSPKLLDAAIQVHYRYLSCFPSDTFRYTHIHVFARHIF